MVNGEAPRRTRVNWWLGLGLLVSIGLNLFLGGLMAGRWTHGPMSFHAVSGRPGAIGEGPGRALFGRMAASLPEEHRATFEAKVTAHQPRISAAVGAMREARGKVHRAVIAEPFDRAALEAAMADLLTHSTEIQREIQTALVDAVSALPPEARRQLGDWRGRWRERAERR